MNRFRELMDDVRQRARANDATRHLVGEVETVEPQAEKADDKEPDFRMPYSSDPQPLEEPWK